MKKTEIEKIVLEMICDHLEINDAKSGDSLKDLGADSLDEVELLMYIEERFNLEISNEEAEKTKTIQDIIDYVDKRR